MSASIERRVKAEPNLTPLLDVVFQLITFFMLVINFSNENYDQRVRLPVAGSARPVEEGRRRRRGPPGPERRQAGPPAHERPGADLDQGDRRRSSTRPTSSSSTSRPPGSKPDATGGLPTTIVLRADRDTPFSSLFSLITACQANGFRKFALKAMNGT